MGTRTIITGTGCFIPPVIKSNRDFASLNFYDEETNRIATPTEEIVEKFEQITGIEERRYAPEEMNSSDMAIIAAKLAIEDSGIDPEELDQIILAQNFGNVMKHTGWVQGVIQADTYFKAGIAKKALIVGTETLSRVIDVYDRDSMIFSDGAGATVLESKPEDETNSGILSWSVQSHCLDEAYYLYLGKSNFPSADPAIRYIKMKGRKVYEYAMLHVPAAMKDCLDKAGIPIQEIKKVFIHQANEKMDEGIIRRLYKLYGIKEIPEHIMPMSINKLGNSSVATIPTLFDMVKKGFWDDHSLQPGDAVLFASVGAGMNINAICYRM